MVAFSGRIPLWPRSIFAGIPRQTPSPLGSHFDMLRAIKQGRQRTWRSDWSCSREVEALYVGAGSCYLWRVFAPVATVMPMTCLPILLPSRRCGQVKSGAAVLGAVRLTSFSSSGWLYLCF